MSDDRPKKSWRELDKARDKSGGSTRRQSQSDRDKDRASQTAAYSAYKNKLGDLFKPGGTELPEHMREALGPQTDEQKKVAALTDALRKTPNEDSLRACVEGEVELPADPRLLMSLLDVRDEALVRYVLERLTEVIEDGKRPNASLLRQRLTGLENWIEERETTDAIAILRAAVKG